MIQIPFTKLHGAENDFLLTWRADIHDVGNDADYDVGKMAEIARRICARHTGIGADGWMLVDRTETGLRTQLINSDGSDAEISGNGTRCAAAFALLKGAASPPDVEIHTAAGCKRLRLLEITAHRYIFEMDMGEPRIEDLHASLRLGDQLLEATILNVGNPQCAIFAGQIPANWVELGREAERHPRFPGRTNVSFVLPLDRHTLQVVFFERGAGETRSSGTGSTGAAVAAILRGIAESPVEIKTPSGSLFLRWEEGIFLTGPAEVIGEGGFFLEL